MLLFVYVFCCFLFLCVLYVSLVACGSLCAFVYVRPSYHPFTLHTILLFPCDGGLVLLATACMYGHTFCCLCVRRAGMGMFTRLHLLVILVGVVIVGLFLVV